MWYVKVQDANGCTRSDSVNIVLPTTAGITNNNSETPVEVYPNPAHGKLNIRLNETYVNRLLEIYDERGIKIVCQKAQVNNTIDVSALNGNYFLKVGDKTVKVFIQP